jgi:hypothetical protein
MKYFAGLDVSLDGTTFTCSREGVAAAQHWRDHKSSAPRRRGPARTRFGRLRIMSSILVLPVMRDKDRGAQPSNPIVRRRQPTS